MMIRITPTGKEYFPRDSNLQNTLILYFGGFWKRFKKNGSDIAGKTHPYEVDVFARNKAINKEFEGLWKGNFIRISGSSLQSFLRCFKDN